MSTTIDCPRRRAPNERPQQILEAALEIFGEHGLVGARLEDIARRAGIAKGTIYLYFPNKEALFREVIRQTVVARLRQTALALDADADTPAADQLDQVMAQWWEYLRTEPFRTVYRLVVSELHRFPDLVEFYAREVLTRGNRLLGGVIERGVARGDFRPVEPYAAARMLSGLIIAHTLWLGPTQALLPTLRDLTPEQIYEQLREFAFSALRPTAAPAAGGADRQPSDPEPPHAGAPASAPNA